MQKAASNSGMALKPPHSVRASSSVGKRCSTSTLSPWDKRITTSALRLSVSPDK
ncbi:hypothetical protein [Pseudomonas syringae]|uniref:hypothetical protein n=1 Tax=Pseudomonas syringae TaxID=317 RepID=UPI001FD0A66C|nr:hypothetical protein [Pseudomonas syringae]